MSDLLTADEIEELTGAKQSAAQEKVLKSNNIYFIKRNDGKINVCWYHVHHPMISSNDSVDDQIDWNAA